MPIKQKDNKQIINDVMRFVKNFPKPYFVFLINKKLKVVALNNKAVKLLNKNNKKNIEGRSLKDLLDKKYFQNFSLSLKKFLKNYKNINTENKFLFNKKEIIVDSLFIPIKGEDEKNDFILCILKDITNFEGHYKNIREAEEKYRYLFENSQNMLFGISSSAKIIEVNKTALDILGYKKEEVIGKSFKKFVAFKYIPLLLKDLTLEMAGEKTDPITIEIKNNKGKLIPVYLYPGSIPIYNKNKKIIGVMVAGRDISSKTEVEKRLEMSEKRFELLFNHLTDGLIFLSPIYNKNGVMNDSEYLEANQSYADLVGIPRERIIGKKVSNIMPSFDVKLFSKFNSVVKSGKLINFEMFYDVNKKYYEIRAFRPRKNTYAIIFRDVTTQKYQEKTLIFQRDLSIAFSNIYKLKEAADLFFKKIKVFPEIDAGAIYFFGDDGNLSLVSSIGFSKEFVKRVSKYELTSKNVKLIKKGKNIFINYSLTNFSKDPLKAKEGIKALVIIPIKNKEKIIGSLNIASRNFNSFSKDTIDLLENIIPHLEKVFLKIKREEEIKESKEKYRILAETQKEGVVIVSANCVVRYINPAFSRLSGYSFEEIVGKNLQNFFSSPNIKNIITECKNIFKKQKEEVFTYELDFIKKDNNIIFVEISFYPLLKNNKINGFHLTIRDISGRKKAEKALEQKVEELEQINRLLVGRELKMVELKKKIARLEREMHE